MPKSPNQEILEGNGLEWDGRDLGIRMTPVSSGMQKSGLTEKVVRTRCEARLREAGFEVVASKDADAVLLVDLTGTEHSYSVYIGFVRAVEYRVPVASAGGQRFFCHVPTWGNTRVGSYDPKKSSYVLSQLDQLLDNFVTEFYKGNVHPGATR